MLSNYDYFLSSTLEECCKNFYNWNLFSCTGTTPTLTNGEYYPDWEDSDTCVKGEEVPKYMFHNQKQYFSPTIQKCCEKHFHWKVNECMGTTPTLTNGEYYPDWEDSHTCVKGGEVPRYMFHNQKDYFSPTLQKCCKKHFDWKVNQCMGTSVVAAYVGTKKWYVVWEESTCLRDCDGALPCGGPAKTWNDLYSSREQCCELHLSWNRDLIGRNVMASLL